MPKKHPDKCLRLPEVVGVPGLRDVAQPARPKP